MSSVRVLEADLKIASKILEWEIGDIWGHVGVRLPNNKGITAKVFRPPADGKKEDWIVRFDYSHRKLSGVGGVPNESAIYTGIFKSRPDVNAIAHCHAPMCIALSMANRQIGPMHIQSRQYAGGIPIFPKPIYIIDEEEGAELAKTLGGAIAVVIRGHGIVTVGATVEEACMNALNLERTAKMQAIANALGFQGVDEEFMRHVDQTWKKLQDHMERTGKRERYAAEWKYYKRKVLKGEYWSRGWV